MVQLIMTMLTPHPRPVHTPERRDPLKLQQSKGVRKGMGQESKFMGDLWKLVNYMDDSDKLYWVNAKTS